MKMSIKEKYFLAFLLISMFLVLVIGIIDMASAEQETLGTFAKNTCVYLKQTCGNCTYVNITRISAPNSQILISGRLLMTKQDTTYNYSICNISSQLGQYIVDWKADPDGTTTAGNYDYIVTITGVKPTSAQGIIYFFLGILSILFFSLSLYGAIKIKWKHPRNERGNIIGINDLKYLKIFLWFFTYLMLIFITFSFRHVSNVADWDVGANWFNFMFWFLIVFLFPVIIVSSILGIITFFESKRMQDLIKRGIKLG